jgi:hypothetical protein
MWHCVPLVRTNVLEECITSIIRVVRIGELGTLAVTSNRSTLWRNTLFLAHKFLLPWWWKQYVPPKRRFLQEPHGITSKKTPFFKIDNVCCPSWLHCLPPQLSSTMTSTGLELVLMGGFCEYRYEPSGFKGCKFPNQMSNFSRRPNKA